MATTNIEIIGTEQFHNNWSGDPVRKINNIHDYIDAEWQAEIKSGSQYTANIYVTENKEVPASELPNGTLGDRLASAEDWLSGQALINADSFVIIDYYGGDANTYGWGYIGTAGSNQNNAGLADAHWEDNNNLPNELDTNVAGTEAVACHECLHTYDAQHPDDVTTYGDDDISVMYSWDGVNCDNQGNTSRIIGQMSTCTVSSVHDHIDKNNWF